MKEKLQQKDFPATQTDHYPSRLDTAPRVMARRDPIVYSEWTIESPLTRAQTENYAQNGFLTLPDILTSSEVACLQREMEALQDDSRIGAIDPELLIQEPGNGALRSIFKVHQILLAAGLQPSFSRYRALLAG